MAMGISTHVIIKLTAGVVPKRDGDLIIISSKPFILKNVSVNLKIFILALRDGIEEKLFENYGENKNFNEIIAILK